MRGDGRIFPFKGTRFLWCAYYLGGKEYRESTKTSDRKEAERFLRRRLKEVHSAELGHCTFVGPRAQRLSVDDLLRSLEENLALRDRYSAPTASGIEKLRKRFGSWRALAVTSDTLTAYIRELQAKGLANATINRCTQLLGQAFRMAQKQRRLAEVPTIPHLSEKGNTRTGFLIRSELDRILFLLPEYLRDPVLFAYLTSWRRGEVFSLRWTDVDGQTIRLRDINSKEREPRSVPLEGDLATLIERRRRARKGPLVFHHAGKPIADFRKAWATATRKAGCPGRLFHDLRRSGVRNMICSGVPALVAMSISGHKTDSMLRRYAIIDETVQRDALRRAQEFRQAETVQPVATARVQ